MKIDSIQNGIVIDHIRAGKGLRIFELLHLKELPCAVAIIMNAVSSKMGKKDIIKIDGDYPIDMDILGYVDPDVTVNIIRGGVLTEKKHINLPRQLTDVIFCHNPRCITTTEQELPNIFRLSDPETKTYRCIYCESKAKE